MGTGEWIALGTFALAILGGLANVVWLLARMNERLDALCKRVDHLSTIETRVQNHEVRIAKLEVR